MRLGIVDLGTMSLRLDVSDTGPNRRPILVARYRSMPRLGDALFQGSDLTASSLAALVAEFQKVRDFCNAHGVEKIVAVGTGVLRESPGSESLLYAAKEQTGIEVRVLSGEEEAQLTALGIFSNEPELPDSLALVDIGGGSTEISFCAHRTVVEMMSINVGALRLEKELLRGKREKGMPYPAEVLRELEARVVTEVDPYRDRLVSGSCRQIVGSSGTIRTLEKLGLCKSSAPPVFTETSLAELYSTLCRLSLDETLALPMMEPARADVILPGACILLEVMQALNAQSVRVSHFSLRHGVLEEALGGR